MTSNTKVLNSAKDLRSLRTWLSLVTHSSRLCSGVLLFKCSTGAVMLVAVIKIKLVGKLRHGQC
jgi:hypothetical protein